MSKIGKNPVLIPEGVTVTVDNNIVVVKGPKGELSQELQPCVQVKIDDGAVALSVASENDWKYRGLSRTLVSNMIQGVTEEYIKKLLIIGVGYNAQVQGDKIILSLGFSHKINFPLPQGIDASTEQDSKGNHIIILKSIDKQLVGQVAAKIRGIKPPEPYKGK